VRVERETSLPKITRIVRAQIRKNSRTSVFVTKQLTPQLTNKKIQYTHLSLKLRVVIMRICALTTIQTTTTRCCCSLLLFFYSDFYENDACGGVHGGDKPGKSV
jgi:hypothetical protein